MELFEFRSIANTASGETKRYTSALEVVTVGSGRYPPIPIQRKEISREFDKNELKITMTASAWPASEFKLLNPAGIIEITIRNIDDVIIFYGRVIACEFNFDKGEATIIANSVQSVFESAVPVRTYSEACNHELYSGLCGLSAASYRITLPYNEVTVVDNTVTHADIGAQPDGYYDNGWVETNYERGMILHHIGSTLTLLFPLRTNLSSLTSIYVYPGCDKTLATCETTFNNVEHYGGFPFVPTINPTREEF